MYVRFTLALLLLLCSAVIAPFCLAQSDLDLDVDFDGDGIINRFDNCHIYPNPSQFDADSDGYGNICDTDLNNDGVLDFEDLSIFSEVIFTNYKPADFNEDGNVNFLDLRIFRVRFASGIPGPALVVRWVGGSGFWHDVSNWRPATLPSFLFQHVIISTPDDVVVTIEESEIAGAKTLELDGNLVACGFIYVDETTTVHGTIGTGCSFGSIDAPQGIDLDGSLILDSGNLRTSSIRRIDETASEIVVNGFAIIEKPFSAPSLTTDVDIVIQPGAKLTTFADEIVLDDASIHLQSDHDLPAVLELPNTTISGVGTVEFEGPSDESATGTIFSFGAAEIGPGIEVLIEPDAYAFFDSQITNYGNIVVSNSATLFFDDFSLFLNSGQINCSSNGRLLERASGPAGDSILINNEDGELIVENCSMGWPTRVINQGRYEVSTSQVSLPSIGSADIPLEITDSDISVELFQPPLPADFYLFDPINNNSVLVNRLFDIGNQTLLIDASKWRFAENQPAGYVGFQFGTIVSETPLRINTDSSASLLFVLLDTKVILAPASELIVQQGVELNRDLNFAEHVDCDAAPLTPAVLRLDSSFDASSNATISAVSSSDAGCLSAEIVTDFQNSLPQTIDILASNAAMKIYSEGSGSLEIKGDTMVSGANAELTLQQVVNSGTLVCSEGATLNALGSAEHPFVNELLLSSTDCDINLTDYWQNNGDVFTNSGTLSLSGPDGIAFEPGAGTFFSDSTDITFNLTISDPSQLEGFKVVPPGGTFTFAGTITNTGPVFDVGAFPFNTQFTNGFELADTRVTGIQPLRLTGTTTLRNVELATNTYVLNNSTVNVFDQLMLDDAALVIQSNSVVASQANSQAKSVTKTPATTRVQLNGVSDISGSGVILFEAFGEEARSELIQTVDDTSVSIGADIELQCYSMGQCTVSAGPGSGELDIFGNIFVSDELTRFRLESDTNLYRTTSLFNRSQLHIADKNLKLSGPDAVLEIELIADTISGPGIVAEGIATIDISEASLSFIPGFNYVLESDEEVTVLEHEGEALRIGEFVDISGAEIDGQPFTPDYSSPDVTIFRGPMFGAPSVPTGR